MSNTTANTGAFVEAQQYDSFIYTNLFDTILPTIFYRDVSAFGSGTTLNIKTIGDRTIQDLDEEEAIDLTPIDSNTITMTIGNYVGDGLSVSDVLRQDGNQVEQLLMQSSIATARAISEDWETKAFQTLNAAQTADDGNDVNGFAHRVASGETNDIISLDHLVEMKLAFDKANVPAGGRILLVDPVVEATLNKLTTTTESTDFNHEMKGILNTGFASDKTFLKNIYGWNIMTSNRLPTLDTQETIDTVVAPIGSVGNIFMSVIDDNHKPLMNAWRQQPMTEFERNPKMKRDEFYTSARYGFGSSRLDTLGIVFTSPTATE